MAICGTLPNKVRVVITHLCFLFNDICRKVIDPQKLDELENEATVVLCQMEMYFPPSFFDIMVHEGVKGLYQEPTPTKSFICQKDTLLKNVLSFARITLQQLTLWVFLKVDMTGHDEVRVHVDTMS